MSTLLYCMGPDADNVLASMNISSNGRKDYNMVMAQFKEFFKVRKNTIYERVNSAEGTSVKENPPSSIITALYELVKTGEYGDMRNEMLRDQLVIGIKDKEL